MIGTLSIEPDQHIYLALISGRPLYKILCRQLQQSNIHIELNDPLNITEVTTQAFEILGEQGVIRSADQHSCSECTQPYKKTSDSIMNDPAAVVGVDENQDIPPLQEADEAPDSSHPISPVSIDDSHDSMDVDQKNVTMVVLDGIVMGPTVIFFLNTI